MLNNREAKIAEVRKHIPDGMEIIGDVGDVIATLKLDQGGFFTVQVSDNYLQVTAQVVYSEILPDVHMANAKVKRMMNRDVGLLSTSGFTEMYRNGGVNPALGTDEHGNWRYGMDMEWMFNTNQFDITQFPAMMEVLKKTNVVRQVLKRLVMEKMRGK